MAVLWFRRLLLAWSVSGCVIVTERPVDSAPPPAPPPSPVRALAEAPEQKARMVPAAGSAAPAREPAPAAPASAAPAQPGASPLPAPAL